MVLFLEMLSKPVFIYLCIIITLSFMSIEIELLYPIVKLWAIKNDKCLQNDFERIEIYDFLVQNAKIATSI